MHPQRADHEALGDRAYAAGAYRDALAEYQLGVKAGATADLLAKGGAAALHTQDYGLAASEYRALAEKDRSRTAEAAEGLERVVHAALAAHDRAALASALAALQALAPGRSLGRYARVAALDAAARGDTAAALALLPGAVAAAQDGRSADSLLFVYGMTAARVRDCQQPSCARAVIRRHRESSVSTGAWGAEPLSRSSKAGPLDRGDGETRKDWFKRATSAWRLARRDAHRLSLDWATCRLAQGDVGGASRAITGDDGGKPR